MNPLVIITAFIVGVLLGGTYIDATKNAELAQVKASVANAERESSDAALERLQAAIDHGNTLENRLAAAVVARQAQALESQREIKRLTSNRPCLNAGTVRLLNQSAGGDKNSAVPETASRTAADDAAAATDTDVAEWADLARRQYDTCRDRLGALIEFSQFNKGE